MQNLELTHHRDLSSMRVVPLSRPRKYYKGDRDSQARVGGNWRDIIDYERIASQVKRAGLLLILLCGVCFGGSISLDGTGDYFYQFYPDARFGHPNPTSDVVTWSIWCRATSLSTGSRVLVDVHNSSGDAASLEYVVNWPSEGQHAITFLIGGNEILGGSVGNPNSGDWIHVAVVFKIGSACALYVDGALIDSAASDATWTDIDGSDRIAYGARWNGTTASDNYTGWIDEIVIQNSDTFSAYSSGWSATITPPTTPFVQDADSIMIYNFDGLVAGEVGNLHDDTIRDYWDIQFIGAGDSVIDNGFDAFTPTTAIVPDVVGMTQSAASAELVADGLTVGTVTDDYSDTVAEGLVISQDDVATTEVAWGHAIDLVISLGQPLVPGIIGLSIEDATEQLTLVTLVVGTTSATAYSNTIAAGNITATNPEEGTPVAINSAVDLTISSGRPQVPDLVGMTYIEAGQALNAVDLYSGGFTSSTCSDAEGVSAGDIAGSSPAAGTTVDVGSTVDLILSWGACPEVPGGGLLHPLADGTEPHITPYARGWLSRR